MKKGIIFDLDGTLWDSAENVCRAWNEVFEARGLSRRINPDEMHRYMGKTLDQIGELMFPETEEALRGEIMNAACTNENAYLAKHGGILFEDVVPVLERLRAEYSLFIVSNCQAGYIETFLGFFGLSYLFEDFECPGRTGLGKAENNRLVMERCSLDRAVYVGDTGGDLDAADAAGIPFIHAAYGFGTTNREVPKIRSLRELPEKVKEIFGE
ncbi:MAG: HAD family hydrolase [Oscillospiraceae bacterium]